MKVKLNRVRLSFPVLFTPKSVNDSEPRYAANFLLSKKDDAAQIAALRTACMAVAKEKWPAKVPAGVKYCVHDGAEKDYEGYNDTVMYLSSSNTMRPPVVDQNLSPITADDRKIYAGCYVNAVIRLWAQDNQFGKRINAQLQTIQLVADGESFGEKPVDPNEEFAPIAADGAAPTADQDGGNVNPADEGPGF